MLTVYRAISYLLLMVACFLTLSILLSLGVALANPPLLLPVFLLCGVVLYSFSSFQFLNKGIRAGQKMKVGRKDFIKVNAFVSLFFGVMIIVQVVTFIANPELLKEMMNQLATIPEAGMTISKEQMYVVMQSVLWFLLIYAIALVVHIQFTFRLLKTHASVFDATR